LAVLKAQAIGSLIITVATLAVSLAVMYAIKGVGLLRVSGEGEAHGLDLHEHGISAYPEYLISPAGRPAGMTFAEAKLDPSPVAQLSASETLT
jgi:Amt family ammonium transporter